MNDPLRPFAEAQILADGRTWTAEYESWDPRTDNVYFFVAVVGGDPRSFWVRVSKMGFSDPERERQHLREAIARHADKGETNTEYEGSVPWQMEHRSRG